MSANGKEMKLAIRILGTIDKTFATSLATTKATLSKSVSQINGDFAKLDKGFDATMKVGKTCFKAIATAASVATLAVGAAAAAAIKIGSDFETAFAGVKKTVDATEEQFAELRKNIIDMSLSIPAAATEIAGVMEIAGQLGIATESLTEFTKTMINLGVSTNMSAEDAATALARFANIVSMADYGEDGISNWERLGSVIVDLGNNFATTEEEIVTMATNLASTGHLVGLTEAQMMAVATAMSSVGIKAEKGGSTMSKLFKKIQLAIEKNSKVLKQYASVANMSVEEFSKAFRDDALAATTAFIDGLDDVERNGKSAVLILDEMGLNEVRLSNTILALAGADDLLSETIKTANEAWTENVALTEEANKRYETVESRWGVLKNSVTALGIAAYDGFRDPLVSVLGTVTEKIQAFVAYVGGPNGISKWLKNIGEEIPILAAKAKKYGKAILGFFQPLLNIGKWFLKNPKVIISAIIGIGTALTAYKIASTITHVTNAIISFLAAANPVTFVILGLVGAVGAIATAIASYKITEQQLIDQNLVEHFGRIKLSMSDIQRIAEYIVSSDSLGGVRKALDAFSDLDEISSAIETTISELEKMNWKVTIGMELSEDEQGQYKERIAEYVEAAQSYALQAQYAVSLNLSLQFDESDLEQSNLVTKINQFYADKYTELESLGKQLNEAVTDAFNDGLLEIEELNVVASLQSQMAEIQKALAVGELDASLSLMQMTYSGANLDPETFMALQEELNTQIASAKSAYEESYKKGYAAATASYNGGYLSDAEYQATIDQLKQTLTDELSNIEVKALQFQLSTISEAYADDLADYQKAVQDAIDEYSASGYDWQWETTPALIWDTLVNAIMENGPGDTTKKAVEELLDNMQGPISDLYTLAADFSVLSPAMQQAVSDTIHSIELLQGLTARNSSSAYVNGLYANVGDTINGRGIDGPIGKWAGQFKGSISAHANGGLVSRKELSWLAERGPEMVVPLDGSKNAVSLWEKTGRLLGMRGAFDSMEVGSSAGSTIEYNPTLNFYGAAPSEADITSALRTSQAEFEVMMERYLRNKARTAF